MRRRSRLARGFRFGEESMPKRKTKKGASKRMKMSATGKILHTRSGKGHLNACKSRKRKRNLRGMTLVNEADHRRIKRMLAS
jgi:large subunit ribosomal protein L35